MRVSHNWLKELLPGLSLTPQDLGLKLTALGLEVDGTSHHGDTLDSVLVVRVETIEPHPERDKLQLVTVSKGSGETQRVVCGAGNVPAPGGLVVLAPLGTHLPAVGMTLSPRKIAGVLSEGMLCSETELGLAAQSEGIIVLEAGSVTPGQRFVDAFPEARDTVYELSITPNRPDALGHIGVARDLAAVLKLDLVPPQSSVRTSSTDGASSAVAMSAVAIENRAPARCPRYGAAIVSGVRVGPSPAWLRWRLHRLGVRPISNVVDITNLLLLEFGQPMHAFDLSLLQGSKVVIREARDAEPFTTLDGVARQLSSDDLVICDAERPVALAGIMGGENTEIRASTEQVLLECAYFTPSNIRRSARRHGMHTESSHRFERGVDWGSVEQVLERAKALLETLAGGKAQGGNSIVAGDALQAPSIRLRKARLDALLGTAVPFEEAIENLACLGFQKQAHSSTKADEVVITGASWRPDVALEVDLIEEVARIRGYASIPTALPKIAPQPTRTTGKLERATRRAATELGLCEAVTFSFVASRDLALLSAPEPVVTLVNPLTEERSVMRTSLLPGLIEVLGRARRRGEQQARLFTVGSIFLAPTASAPSAEAAAARPRAADDKGVVPDERPVFSALIAGSRSVHLSKPEPLDIYDAKAIALGMVQRLTGKVAEVSLIEPGSGRAKHLHPRGAATLRIGECEIGSFGPLHPDVIDGFDLGTGALVVEIDLSLLESVGQVIPKYRAIPRLPAVSRDIALEVKREISAARVQRIIREAGGELCESVELFDLFEGAPVKDGHRSLAFHVVYRDPNAITNPDAARTLTDAEVDARHDEVVRLAREQLGATLRA